MYKHLITLTSIAAFFISCTPLGYMQSPRVMPGFEIGSHFNKTTPYRAEDSKSNGFWPRYYSVGIRDRVRFSAGWTGPLLYIKEQDWIVSTDLMINIIDRGEPKLFKNIAAGTLLSANARTNVFGGEEENEETEKSVTGGVLASTGMTLYNRGKLELIGGLGITYNKSTISYGEHSEWYHRGDFGENGKISPDWYEYRDGSLNFVVYSIDVSNSIQFYPTEKRRFSISAGYIFSGNVHGDSWYAGDHFKYQRAKSNGSEEMINKVELSKAGLEILPYSFAVKAGISFRFGGTESIEEMSDQPRGPF